MTRILPIIAVIPPAERLHQGGQYAMPLGRVNVCLKCGGETLGNTPLLEPCPVVGAA